MIAHAAPFRAHALHNDLFAARDFSHHRAAHIWLGTQIQRRRRAVDHCVLFARFGGINFLIHRNAVALQGGGQHIADEAAVIHLRPCAVVVLDLDQRALGHGQHRIAGQAGTHAQRRAVGGDHRSARRIAIARIARIAIGLRDIAHIHIAALAAILRIAPIAADGKHGQHRAGGNLRQYRGGQASLRAQVERACILYRAVADQGGRRYNHTVHRAAGLQAFLLHIAVQDAAGNEIPIAIDRVHHHRRALGQSRDDIGRAVGRNAQRHLARCGSRLDHTRAGAGAGRQSRGIGRQNGGTCAAAHFAQNCAHKGIGHHAAAAEIEAQNLIIAIAQFAHAHRAALAHARAVAKAPRLHGIAAGCGRYRPQLVAGGVDAHVQGRFQFAEDIKGQRTGAARAVCRDGHVKIQLGIQAAGRGIARRMRRNGIDGFNAHTLRAKHGLGLSVQKTAQRAVALRAAFIHLEGTHNGSGILIIVGIVLDGNIIILGGAPDVAHRFNLSAVGRGIIGSGIGIAVHGYKATGFLHHLHTAGVARGRAVIHLIVGSIHHVVAACSGGVHGTDGISTRRNALRLERFQRGGIAHLIGQHAAQIILNKHMRDGIQLIDAAAADGFELQIARIQIAADARLADLHTVVRSAGRMAAQAKIRAHGGGHAVLGQGQLTRCAVKAHRHRAAVGQGGRAAAIQRVAAANGNIQPRGRTQRGQIHAHRAIHGGILRQSGFA